MPFCSLNKLIDKLTSSSVIDNVIEASFVDQIEVRRFGLNNGVQIAYDEFGEPIDLSAQQNYTSYIHNCTIEVLTEENDEKSAVGGRGSSKEYMKINVSLTADIVENDLIVYPIGSNDVYRVRKDYREMKNKKRFIFAYGEVRSTK